MDGLIIGTVAGFGFAVVETAGYGLCALLEGDSLKMGLEGLLLTMVVRGLTSPFCHGLWTGILAAAFWQSGRSLKRAFRSKVFWVGAAWAVGLHALWNGSSMLTEPDAHSVGCGTLLFIGLGYALMLVTAALSVWQYRGLLLHNGYRREKRFPNQPRAPARGPTKPLAGAGAGWETASRSANRSGPRRGSRAASVEARGFEPRSQGESASASTCVALLFSTGRTLRRRPSCSSFAFPGAGRAKD